MGIITQIKQWGWLIVLSLIVIIVVTIAYNETPNAEPLDGVGTLASLLLTVFLVYIYSHQNTILKNQEEILEEQRETQEAADVSPRLHINEPNYSGNNITVDIKNNGSGPAYDVYLITDIEVPNTPEIQGGVWKKSLSRYIPDDDSESSKSLLEFSISSSPSKLFQVSFLPLSYFQNSSEDHVRDMKKSQSGRMTWVSEYIFNNSDLDLGEQVQVSIDVSIIYYDSLDNEFRESIDHFILNFEGLAAALYEEEVTRPIHPKLGITEIGTFPDGKWHDKNMIGFDIKNRNGNPFSTAYSLSVDSFLKIKKSNYSQDIKKYLEQNGYELQISGAELSSNFHCPDKIPPNEEEFHGYAYRVTVNDEEKTVSEMCEELITNNIHVPMCVGLKLKYEDSIGREYLKEVTIENIYIGDDPPDYIPTHRYIQSSDPLKLTELTG